MKNYERKICIRYGEIMNKIKYFTYVKFENDINDIDLKNKELSFILKDNINHLTNFLNIDPYKFLNILVILNNNITINSFFEAFLLSKINNYNNILKCNKLINLYINKTNFIHDINIIGRIINVLFNNELNKFNYSKKFVLDYIYSIKFENKNNGIFNFEQMVKEFLVVNEDINLENIKNLRSF